MAGKRKIETRQPPKRSSRMVWGKQRKQVVSPQKPRKAFRREH
jgi:hypothetical protein